MVEGARTSKRVVPCSDIVDVLKWMNGNGTPGAKARLALLEDGLKDIKDDLKWLIRAVVGLILTVIGSLIIFAVTVWIPNTLGG